MLNIEPESFWDDVPILLGRNIDTETLFSILHMRKEVTVAEFCESLGISLGEAVHLICLLEATGYAKVYPSQDPMRIKIRIGKR